jgi:hypothetical protein
VASAVAAAVSLTFTSPALAVPQPYQFTGRVTTVAPVLSSRFTVGDPVRGFVTIETTPTIDRPGARSYPASNLMVNFGSSYTVTSAAAQLQVYDNVGVDRFLLDCSSQLGLMAPTVNGHVPDYFTLDIVYPKSGISSTNLLPQFPLGGGFPNLRFDVNDSIEVNYRLIDFSAVPEPSAAMGCIAATLLTLCRRRRRGASVQSWGAGLLNRRDNHALQRTGRGRNGPCDSNAARRPAGR